MRNVDTREVIGPFVDIGGIDDHHCLNLTSTKRVGQV